MKKSLSFIVIILLFFALNSLNAQINIGVRAGFNLAKMNTSNSLLTVSDNMIPSFQIGPYVGMNLTKKLGLESAIYISGKGVNSTFSQNFIVATISGSIKTTPYYLELPVNAIYNFKFKKMQFHVFAGPYLGYAFGGNIATDVKLTGLPIGINLDSLGFTNETRSIEFGADSTSDMKPFDMGFNFGIGTEINKFVFRIQYGLGMINIASDNPTINAIKNRVLNFSVAYRLF
jgi:hypothetical protein